MSDPKAEIEQERIRILLVEDNREFANLVQLFLRKHEPEQFDILWKENGAAALAELEASSKFDLILMDYFLPGQNGLEVTRILRQRGNPIPVVFLTVNKDFDLAVEVMKLGVEDYLVKEEISTPVLPKTILNVIERKKLKDQLTHLEITQKRLETIREIVVKITQEIRMPLDGMRMNVDAMVGKHTGDNLSMYLGIINDNLVRIERKIAQLKDLKTDRTVPYIRDIRMIDLSE
jgi:sigma-B regulation protein RsbU (phosphoserine phosphatase)